MLTRIGVLIIATRLIKEEEMREGPSGKGRMGRRAHKSRKLGSGASAARRDSSGVYVSVCVSVCCECVRAAGRVWRGRVSPEARAERAARDVARGSPREDPASSLDEMLRVRRKPRRCDPAQPGGDAIRFKARGDSRGRVARTVELKVAYWNARNLSIRKGLAEDAQAARDKQQWLLEQVTATGPDVAFIMEMMGDVRDWNRAGGLRGEMKKLGYDGRVVIDRTKTNSILIIWRLDNIVSATPVALAERVVGIEIAIVGSHRRRRMACMHGLSAESPKSAFDVDDTPIRTSHALNWPRRENGSTKAAEDF